MQPATAIPQRRLWLAPIRGVTDAAWRTHFTACFGGFDVAISPFLAPEKHKPVREKDLIDAIAGASSGLPTVPQILSAEPEEFLQIARSLADRGCDEVNWNLGCPYPMVVRRGRGAGLLPMPDRIAAFLDQVCPKLPCRLSIKMRVGLHDASDAAPVLQAIEPFPLSLLIIHPRTAGQMYGGQASVEAFADALPLTRHRVAFNGDITSVGRFRELEARFPAINDWMIGRGALSNPWLPSAIAGRRSEVDQLVTIKQFHDAMLDHYQTVLSGPGHVLDKMTGLWKWLAEGVESGGRPIKKLLKAKTLEGYRFHLPAVFESKVRWRAT